MSGEWIKVSRPFSKLFPRIGDEFIDVKHRDGRVQIGVNLWDIDWGTVIAYRFVPKTVVGCATPQPEWIHWAGGECPVSPNTVVEVKLREGSLYKHLAVDVRWHHCHDDARTHLGAYDIVAYRVVKPQPNCLGCEQAVCDTCEPIKRDQPTPIYAALDTLKDSKPTNPKDAIGSVKLPLHLWPAEATALGSLGMLEGDCKYGRNNYIAGDGVIASIYVDAAKRHLDAWFSGEEFNPDLFFAEDGEPGVGLSHLGNALASIAIIVKAQAHGKLIDDRDFSGSPRAYRKFVDDLTPLVKKIQGKFADKKPKRYTIADNPKEE